MLPYRNEDKCRIWNLSFLKEWFKPPIKFSCYLGGGKITPRPHPDTHTHKKPTNQNPQKKVNSQKPQAKAVPVELRKNSLSSCLFFRTILTKLSRWKRRPDLPADCEIVWLARWWFPFHPELVPFLLLITASQLWDSCCSSLLPSYLEIEKCALPMAFCTSAFACLLAVVHAVVFVTSTLFLFSFTSLSKMLWETESTTCVWHPELLLLLYL